LNHSIFLTLLGVEAYNITSTRRPRLLGMTEHGRRGHHPRSDPPTWTALRLWFGPSRGGGMPGDSMYPPLVSLQLEMGFKCRTLVRKFVKMKNGKVIHLLRNALTCISLPQPGWSKGPQNVYGVSGTYKCGRCRRLHRKVIHLQTLVDMILEV
jgi:hypothetical protein